MRVFRVGMLALLPGVAVWWHLTPTILPTSPRPRLSQPSARATFRPLSFSTCGNQVNENVMSGHSSFGCRKIFIGCWHFNLDVASVNVFVLTARSRSSCFLKNSFQCGECRYSVIIVGHGMSSPFPL